jgi:hypothetical protein
MRTYPTQKQLQELFEYDPATGIFRSRIHRRANFTIGTIAGKKARDGYTRITVDNQVYQASWLAWIYMTGEIPAVEIDHINSVRHDDRFANLREANRAQNCQGRINFWKPNQFGFRGVKKNHKKFSAAIVVNQKGYHLGVYDTPEEAARAYDIAAKKHFGVFARLNFPTEIRRDWLIV